jgi:hypothetical protein
MAIIGFMIQDHGVNIIKPFWYRFTHSFFKSIPFNNTENEGIINTMAEPTINMSKFMPKNSFMKLHHCLNEKKKC